MTITKKKKPLIACPWNCGYYGEPLSTFDVYPAENVQWKRLNPLTCPQCGESGGYADWGYFDHLEVDHGI